MQISMRKLGGYTKIGGHVATGALSSNKCDNGRGLIEASFSRRTHLQASPFPWAAVTTLSVGTTSDDGDLFDALAPGVDLSRVQLLK
jgi:hypothetical protein